MRLGAPLLATPADPDEWIATLKRKRYSAAYCPIKHDADAATVAAFVHAAHEGGVVIAEVGAWNCNSISPDDDVRRDGIAYCQRQLDLAERIGARCCVAVIGSRDAQWDGPHPDNLTETTFDLVVDTVREIIDAVRPARTCFALEMMPWTLPDGPDANMRLIEAIERPALAVHLDPVNIVNSPRRYYGNGALIRECFDTLGPYVRSVHAKDVLLHKKLTVHIDEVRPGLGELDYAALLRGMGALPRDTPFMLEHLPSVEEYDLAAAHVRRVADDVGVPIL
jgi:sugar phosphate isomerase/epimerase